MRMSSGKKLFLAVLVACTLVTSVQTIVMRETIQKGFLKYLNDQGVARMERFVPNLEAAYRKHGSWTFLENNLHEWFTALLPQSNEFPMTIADQTGATVRIGLLDDRLQHVAGNLDVGPSSLLRPVKVDGRVVGWIAMVPFQQILSANDLQFVEQQRKAWLIIGIASLIIILVLTAFLTRPFLKRVRRLASATHTLAAGEYSSRIEDNSQDELGSLARDFNRMAQAMEKNEQARRTFMADISHELRTPLSIIKVEVEAIIDGIRQPTPQSLEAVNQEVTRLDKLIDDLHDLSLTDIDTLTYDQEPVDVVTILDITLRAIQGKFEAAGLRLEKQLPEQPLILNGDEGRLQQLFSNLLENSLRYTQTGGEVRVQCTSDNGRVRILIDDSAPGVAHDQIPHLFERFYRVDASRNRARGGSGLGLAICRNIVEAHQGTIEASASPLGGLRIVLTLGGMA